MNKDFFATPKVAGEKVWNEADILKMWPQAAGELRGFRNALERNAGITASQLGMALQLADVEFQRLLGAPNGATAVIRQKLATYDAFCTVCGEESHSAVEAANWDAAVQVFYEYHKTHKATPSCRVSKNNLRVQERQPL